MENKNISQITLDKIKSLKVKPTSKIFFSFKKIFFWFLIILSIIIGSIAFSISISLLINTDWNLYHRLGFSHLVKTLPYFWLICLILFMILGEYYYKKTFLGYRHRMIVIIGFYMLITVVFGITLYSLGLDGKFERSLYRKIPIYQIVNLNRERIWLQPEEGLLSGKIILVDKDEIRIVDKNGLLWKIKIENSFIGGRVNMTDGECIKIIGDIEDIQTFKAEEIRPCFNNIGKMNLFHKMR